MKRTIQQAVTARAVKQEHFEEWVRKEANQTLKDLYEFANMRYTVIASKTTAATAAYTSIWTEDLADNTSWMVETQVVGRATAGGPARAGYRLIGLFFREGGGAVQQGATTILATIESVGAFDARFSVSGNSVSVQVLDDGVRTVAWQVIVWTQEVTH